MKDWTIRSSLSPAPWDSDRGSVSQPVIIHVLSLRGEPVFEGRVVVQ